MGRVRKEGTATKKKWEENKIEAQTNERHIGLYMGRAAQAALLLQAQAAGRCEFAHSKQPARRAGSWPAEWDRLSARVSCWAFSYCPQLQAQSNRAGGGCNIRGGRPADER